MFITIDATAFIDADAFFAARMSRHDASAHAFAIYMLFDTTYFDAFSRFLSRAPAITLRALLLLLALISIFSPLIDDYAPILMLRYHYADCHYR